MTTNQPRLLGFYAHPDDEVLGIGGTLAQYSANGVYIEWVVTTRGEAGEISDPALATSKNLGMVREREMHCSAQTLGMADVTFLGYRDSGMAGTADNQRPDAYINADDDEVVAKLVAIIRRVRPHVALTFEPFGGYGHPDHIAIHKHTHLALAAADDPDYRPDLGASWHTQRLFYPILRRASFMALKERMMAHGLPVDFFDGLEKRRANAWPDDKYQVAIQVNGTTAVKWTAFNCHRTQFGEDSLFRRLPESEMSEFFSTEYFALAYPEPEAGLQLHSLFEGLTLD
ncbi:MAG: PIG-L family deacetylase [Anaerolineae bacterium]|nr:PIG-L family deacetylase [Anaerolineae bacterium]